MGVGSGRLTGLVTVRDDLAVTYQSQLDEIARGLDLCIRRKRSECYSGAARCARPVHLGRRSCAFARGGTITAGLAGSISGQSSSRP